MRGRGAIVLVAAFAAVGCSSTAERRLRIESWPRGATVRVGDGGRIEGQTPIEALNLKMQEEGALILLIEKDGYQTVAYKLDASSPDYVFIPMVLAPDTEKLAATVKDLQHSVDGMSAALNALRSDIERSKK